MKQGSDGYAPVIPFRRPPAKEPPAVVFGNVSDEQLKSASLHRHTISIGTGVVEADFDIVIANPETKLRFARNGEVFLNGRLLGSDPEIFEGLRCLLRPMMKDY